MRFEISKLARFFEGACSMDYLHALPLSELYELISDANEIHRREMAAIEKGQKR